MATADFILFPGPTTWRIARAHRGRTDAFDVPVTANVAAAVRAALEGHGFTGQPVVLAVASGDCLCARIATADLPRGDRRAMLYRFEEKLPVAAEHVVADFISFDAPTATGDGALGVCVLLDRAQPLVTALEAAGVPVRSVVPATLAVAQAVMLSDADDGPATLLIGEPADGAGPMLSVVTVHAGRPVDWATLPATVADVRLHLDLLSTEMTGAPRIVAIDVPVELAGALADRPSLGVTTRDRPDAAAIADQRRPWVEFRRDALAVTDGLRQHRRAINGALATAAAALVVVAASAFARSLRYDRAGADARARMVAEFRERFPGWVTPTNVRAVVEGEHRRAAAATTGGPATPGNDYGSALSSFHDVVTALPAGDGFALDRMSFTDGSFELAGRLRSYEQVDAIAAAARRSGMDVPPPQARRDPSGAWLFTLQGSRRAPGGGPGR